MLADRLVGVGMHIPQGSPCLKRARYPLSAHSSNQLENWNHPKKEEEEEEEEEEEDDEEIEP